MKNIKIVVDVTGSCELKDVEQQLGKIKNELALKNVKAEVSFFSFGERLTVDLNSLELPMTNTESFCFFMGGDNFNEVLKNKLKSSPDVLIFIGDCIEAPIEKTTIDNTENTQLIFIQSRYRDKNDSKMDKTLVKSF